MASDINGLMREFLAAFQLRLKDEIPELKESLLKSARHVLVDNASNLKRWMPMMASGELSREDVDFLIKAQLDLTRMTALTESGLSLARVDAFKKSLISTLVSSLFKTIGV